MLTKIKQQALRENGRDLKEKFGKQTPIATKGTKRPATTKLSSTKTCGSAVTKDDMMKMANLILDMDWEHQQERKPGQININSRIKNDGVRAEDQQWSWHVEKDLRVSKIDEILYVVTIIRQGS